MAYAPPAQLQDKQIWTLVIKNSRQEKVPEHYYTKKKMPLLSWLGIQQRYKANPNNFEPVVGLVSDELIVIDTDLPKELKLLLASGKKLTSKQNRRIKEASELPDEYKDMVKKYPTHYHKSKSGNGWHIYYFLSVKLPKNWMKHKYGELYNGSFVTTTDPHLTDFSCEQIAIITPDEIEPYIPEIKKKLQPKVIKTKEEQENERYIDGEKMFREAKLILNHIPPDIDPLLAVAYETRLKDFELNSYTHWLLVSHALSDLANTLASEFPTMPEKIASLFLEWSQRGLSFKDSDDTLERFDRSYKETQETTNVIATFKTLRKLYWGYRIPIEDFPVIVMKGKGENKTLSVDPTDPQNYAFLTDMLKLQMCQDYSRGDIYVRGPASLIKNYFKDRQYYFHTHNSDDLSIPFKTNYNSDTNLTYRLINMFRQFGIKGALRNHPLTSGLTNIGVKPIDTLYEWMQSIPWDKVPRAFTILEQSIEIDKTMQPAEVPDEFYYQLIFKHLMHMAGLRAKANRLINNNALLSDRFRKSQGILILAGYQNTRKSTWVECLLPSEAGVVSSVTPSSVKDTLEIQRALSGTFVLNIDEIDAVLQQMSLSDFKNVITQEKDTFRTMYSGKFEDHPRAAGFFGTTNKTQLRLDRTGNRRFWIIPIKSCNAETLISCNYQQFWAELLYYAERISNDDWVLSEEEKQYINYTATKYTSQTVNGKQIDMIFTDDEGESLVYDHYDIDFETLFHNIPQRVQRAFTKSKIFFPLAGNKAFKYCRAQSIMDGDIELKLNSFSHEIAGFIDNTTGIKNETRAYPKGVYKAGIFEYDTGKANPTAYHFIPLKRSIDALIEQEILTPEIFKVAEEKD